MKRHALLVASLVGVVVAAPAHAKDPAVSRTEAFIDALLRVKPDSPAMTAAKNPANKKVFAELDGFFDFDKLTNDPITPRADKFTAKEKADFNKKFREVIRLVAYPDSGSFFRKAKYTVGEAKEEGDVVTVPIEARVEADDLETKVDLHWKKTPQGLRMFDVSFDGDSLVRDYQNQFVKIIDKEGAKGLIAKIDKRRSELEAGPKAK